MSKMIHVQGEMVISGVSGSYSEIQSNRVNHPSATASAAHRHFQVYLNGKLTLNDLKLTWGEVGANHGGSIFVDQSTIGGSSKDNGGGTLILNAVYFDGSKTTIGNEHAVYGGAIYVQDGTVTIKDSFFEGLGANWGGALFVLNTKTSNPMTIESTTFKNNWAKVCSIHGIIQQLSNNFVLTTVLLFSSFDFF